LRSRGSLLLSDGTKNSNKDTHTRITAHYSSKRESERARAVEIQR